MTTKPVVKRKRNEHHETVLCQCGCGQYFDARYTTRKPKYADKKHKAAANNPQRIKAREKRIKELWALRRKCKALARQTIKEAIARGDNTFLGDRAFQARMLSALTAKFERDILRGRK